MKATAWTYGRRDLVEKLPSPSTSSSTLMDDENDTNSMSWKEQEQRYKKRRICGQENT